ncbi:MAG: FAD-dependent oxidoreductase [Candidatus Margulisbacteria bacterium]|nr:FAD-dependent oxidoreductase [Candidatus Margulisiibacteriota bacterium]
MLDTLIIGQGLAGSLLAIKLLSQGQRIKVIDDNHKTSSTKVAAGVMNPITGKRLVKLWPSKEHESFVIEYYHAIEKELGAKLLKCHRLVRFLEDTTTYEKRLKDPAYQPIMKPCDPEEFRPICHVGSAQFSCFPVYQVDTQMLLLSAKTYLQKNEAYIQDNFFYRDLEVSQTGVSWKAYNAKKAVFCEGARGCQNPYFKHLEFENAMGEILEIACNGLPENTILNNGKWLCPTGVNQFKYGATSYWKASKQASIDSEAFLQRTLGQFLKKPFVLKKVHHGVRPVLKSRTPFSGWHPELPIGMVNGFGGQGVSLAPRIIHSFL